MSADSLSLYLQEATRYPLLTKTQEIMLARQVQTWLHDESATSAQKRSGQRAYEKLIKCNLRLVVSVAKRSNNRLKRCEMLDLIQEGNCGLAHGIKKYDPERGYALSTYVYWWIRQSITRYLGCNDRIIRLPSQAVEVLSKLRVWAPTFENIHGRPPTTQECADHCKISLERLQLYMDNSLDSMSLDAKTLVTDGDCTLIDLISNHENPMDDLVLTVRSDYIVSMLDRLDPVDRRIVVGHFALEGGEPKSMLGIGKELGLSRERCRQRMKHAMRQLRELSEMCSSI